MLAVAVASGVLSSLGGAYLSYHLDGSTGGCIVLLQTLLFLIALLLAPKHGLLVRWRSRR
jgi:manganese transport system permease protein